MGENGKDTEKETGWMGRRCLVMEREKVVESVKEQPS